MIKQIALLALSCSISACGFLDKDNTPTPTPLAHFTPEIQPRLLWSTRAGSGSGDEYLRLTPAVGNNAVFTSAYNGIVSSINKTSGHLNWQVNTRVPVTTGPGLGDGIVVVGSRFGDVIALREADGAPLWKITIDGEILAKPAISDGKVVVKSVDGYIRAFSVRDGHELWTLQQVEPSLILRGSSTPLIRGQDIIAGFANGNLAKIGLNNGSLLWTQTIAFAQGAFAIQRMIDIDADPVLFDYHLYAATYQGKIASLDWSTGRTLWSHDISSYTGMVADANMAYITDARSKVWGFDASNGDVRWRQEKLEARVITTPAMMGNYIVVGDAEGYLHWLNKHDGHFAARVSVGAPLSAAPVVDQDRLYMLTDKGTLAAYTISR